MRQSADLKLGLDELSIAYDVDPVVRLGEAESTPAETALHRATSENGDSSFCVVLAGRIVETGSHRALDPQ